MRLDDATAWLTMSDEPELLVDVRNHVFRQLPSVWREAAATRVVLAARPLTTYAGLALVRLSWSDEAGGVGPGPVFAIANDTFVQWLSGEPGDLYAVNSRIPPKLQDFFEDEEIVADYLSLLLETSRGGADWRLVENSLQLSWSSRCSKRRREAAEQVIRPITVQSADGDAGWLCEAVIQRSGEILSRRYLVSPIGFAHALTEHVLIRDRAIAAPDPFIPAGALASLVEPSEAAADYAFFFTGMRTVEADEASGPAEDERVAGVGTRPSYNDVLRTVAQTLLVAAVEGARFHDRIKAQDDKVQAFYDYLREYKPTIAISTPYRELRDDFSRLLADACGVTRVLTWHTSQQAANLESVNLDADRPAIVAITDGFFRPSYDGVEVDAGALLSPVIRGPHIGLFIAENVRALPQDARDMIDFSLRAPRMNAQHVQTIMRSFFPDYILDAEAVADWMRYLLPRDLARAGVATQDPAAYLSELQNTVRRRLAQYTAADAPSLAELNGLGQARDVMEALTGDVRSALHDEIGWDQVDRGYLLVGPPGTGKTTLVRALAKDCGIRFVLASASQWQEGGTLGPHIQNIRRTFREARLYAPSILFIDEIDSLGTRSRIEAHNSQYQTVVINTVLEELQGFEGRDGVIVLGATNNLQDVDPALRRPGRFDHVVEVPYPNVAALASIFDYYLRKMTAKGFDAAAIDTDRLGQMCFGRTGAHVEVYVRGAARRARRDRRMLITEADLLAEILDRPLDGLPPRLPPGALRQVAVHEAGHALFSLTSQLINRPITMVSITPRADGSLGFVARNADDTSFLTRAAMEEEIRFTLAGRAAEQLVFGAAGVSTGAGGRQGSDLEVASRAVTRMLTQFGFSQASGLFWMNWRADEMVRGVTAEAVRNLPLGEEIMEEARGTLDRLYNDAITRLAEHRLGLDRVVALLTQKQDVSNEDLLGALALAAAEKENVAASGSS